MSRPLKYTVEETDRYTYDSTGRKLIFSHENKISCINLGEVRNNEVKAGENYPSGRYDVLDLSDLQEDDNKIDSKASLVGSMTVGKEATTIFKNDLDI
jgi:hypothetical protein